MKQWVKGIPIVALPVALIAALAATFLLREPQMTNAALYWFHGVRGKIISVCFVGNALTSRPDRVQQILDYIKDFEQVANIHFNYLGNCPPKTTQANGDDYYDGDIRVIIPSINISGTGPVPGKGCPMFNQQGVGGYNGDNDGWGSWSNAPDDLTPNRACLYNLKLGDDPWNATPYRNHTLHEFGHALGLAHEHERNDVNAGCTETGYGGGATNGHITFYDRYSVMHYKFASCGIDGNYSYAGLSGWDKLALHIMYPEDVRVAEFVGATTIVAGQNLQLQSLWKARGADMTFAAGNFNWQINGVTQSTTPDLVENMPVAGEYDLALSYTDFLGRSYGYSGKVRVLSSADYMAQAITPGTQAALMAPQFGFFVNIPAAVH
jgi:hypothetical protein